MYYRSHDRDSIDDLKAGTHVGGINEPNLEDIPGVSSCESLRDLREYIRLHGLTLYADSVVVEIDGTYLCEGHDGPLDCRIEVDEVVAVHPLTVLDDEDDEFDHRDFYIA